MKETKKAWDTKNAEKSAKINQEEPVSKKVGKNLILYQVKATLNNLS